MPEHTASWKLKAAVGEEQEWGDAVCVSTLIPILENTVVGTRQTISPHSVCDGGLAGNRITTFDDAGGSFSTLFDSENIHPLLKCLFGKQADGAFYCDEPAVTPFSLTYVVSRFRNKTDGAYPLLEFPGSQLTGLNIAGVAGRPLELRWDLVAKEQQAKNSLLANTSDSGWSYPNTPNILQFSDIDEVTVTFDSGHVADVNKILSFEINISADYNLSRPVDSEGKIKQPFRANFAADGRILIPHYADIEMFDILLDGFLEERDAEIKIGFSNGAEIVAGRCSLSMPEILENKDFSMPFQCLRPEGGIRSPITITP